MAPNQEFSNHTGQIRVCAECGRSSSHLSRGLCGTCYARNKRCGTLPAVLPGGPNALCKTPDCDRTVGRSGAKGYCQRCYVRMKKTGTTDAPARTAPLAVRFTAMTSAELCDCGECAGCRRWTGGINKKTGYGNFSIGNKTYLAHRVAYSLYWLEGEPIPDGVKIDHSYRKGCRHRDCVKREHLEQVRAFENNNRIPLTDDRRARLSAAGKKGAASRKAHGGYENRRAVEVLEIIRSNFPDGVRASELAETGMGIHNARQWLARLARRRLLTGDGNGLYWYASGL